ncbi:MAG: 8-oxo-dGTP diphosphatase [Clostridia bacterium]|nr:8-oxo-dGTP diphosphatase [Clostridia bacterium]
MRTPEKVIFANMCMVYDQNGNVLVQDRVDPKWPGITFPGGHVETGESFTDAVLREVFEETGLTIFSPCLCGIKDWIEEDGTRYVVHLYRAHQFQGDVIASEEGKVFWIPLCDLPKYKLASGMELMLKVFCEEDLSEMFFCKRNGVWETMLK